MPSRAPLLLVTVVALAATLAYLLKTPKRRDDDDDDNNDLELHDDGSDDVTVQVKNGGSSDFNSGLCERRVGGGTAGESAVQLRADASAESYDAPMQTTETKSFDEPVKAADSTSEASKIEEQNDEDIRQEALSKAATIISSMPEVSLVDECIQEVAAAKSNETEIAVDIIHESAATNSAKIEEETEEPIQFEPTEQFVPVKSVPSTPNKRLPKTPPISLFSPSPAQKEIEAPIDSKDYSKLKDYWKHQSDKHAFSPPRSIGTEVAASPVRPPDVESDEGCGVGMARSSSKEENVASAAVAGLMAAGVVNILDHVYSPKGGQQGQSFENVENEEDDIPMLDVSVVDDKTGAAERQEEGSDEQLILGSSSPSSGSDKSSSDDYVKIVRTPSGDPITESALLSRPVENNVDEKDSAEEKKPTILEESAAVVSVQNAEAKPESSAAAENEPSKTEATPQTKSKTKKKKKKGKKK